MSLSIYFGATPLAPVAYPSTSPGVTSNSSLPSNQTPHAPPRIRTSSDLAEENRELFGQYETITRLLSSLHGRIGINDDATKGHSLGRQAPHYIDPKDLKLVWADNLKKYEQPEWVKINEKKIVLQCGIIKAATTGEDWAVMERCRDEEVAIRRLMATFNEEGHEFVVSLRVLQEAYRMKEGGHRCIKETCLTLPIPAPAALQTRNIFSQSTKSQIGSHPSSLITSPSVGEFPQPTTLMTVTRLLTLEDSLPNSQVENEITDNTPTEELPVGRWLSRRAYEPDPYVNVPRPQCWDPDDDFSLSGKPITVTRNPRRTSYTTISGPGFTTTSTVPYDPNRPPPPPSVIYPTWQTASFFQTFSCREVWQNWFNMDDWNKPSISRKIVDSLEAAAMRAGLRSKWKPKEEYQD